MNVKTFALYSAGFWGRGTFTESFYVTVRKGSPKVPRSSHIRRASREIEKSQRGPKIPSRIMQKSRAQIWTELHKIICPWWSSNWTPLSPQAVFKGKSHTNNFRLPTVKLIFSKVPESSHWEPSICGAGSLHSAKVLQKVPRERKSSPKGSPGTFSQDFTVSFRIVILI